MANPQSDLGPTLPSRGEIYAKAGELLALARIAVELSCAGHRADLPRALLQFERMRVVLGPEGGDD